jgi:hypothetical protein
MAELKTKPTKQSVSAFLKAVDNEQRRKDGQELLKMMKDVTGKTPKLWGDSIVGFGTYHYKYKTGREGDWMVTGFSPRKQNLSVYIMPGFSKYQALLNKLGKYKTSVSCLYINKLDDVDRKVLKQIVARAYKDMQKIYPCK